MNYVLTQEDYRDISDLILISNKIKKIYDELYNIEIYKNKDSEEYYNKLCKLKDVIDIENGIYKKIGDNNHKNLTILGYLLKDKIDIKELIEEFLIFSSNPIMSRILNHFIRNIVKDKDIIPEFLSIFFQDYQIAKNEITNSILSSYEFKDSLNSDLINCLLAIIEKEKNIEITDKLKEVKYLVSYLYPDLESCLVKNNFEIEKNPYVGSIFVGQTNKWPQEIIKKIRIMYGLTYYEDTVNSMLQYCDEDLLDNNIKYKLVISQIFLRTVFIILDSETIMELNDSFHIMVDEGGFEFNQKIIEMIKKAYKNVKRDKSIPKILSLKM